MTTRFIAFFALLTVTALLPTGCGANKDCVALCDEAQDGDCTAVDGSCSAFCDALDAIEDDAGCGDERADYEDCLNGEADVCDTSCGSEENALVTCMIPYCQSNPNDGDCQTLAAAFL